MRFFIDSSRETQDSTQNHFLEPDCRAVLARGLQLGFGAYFWHLEAHIFHARP